MPKSSNVKVVILAGGLGTRLEEETGSIPKPLVSIGEYPILWHIMKGYAHWGFHDFVICLGYKGHMIKEYFADYFLRHSDVTFDFSREGAPMTVHTGKVEPWRVTLVYTGSQTQTGGRIKRVEPYIDSDTFMLTYGDAVSDIHVPKLLNFHNSHGKAVTLSAVQPPGKWGALTLGTTAQVESFVEKPAGDGNWINGGFFVLNRSIFKSIKGDDAVWESDSLRLLSKQGQVMSFRHKGFWKCVDTLRDKRDLEQLWLQPAPPWKLWNDH